MIEIEVNEYEWDKFYNNIEWNKIFNVDYFYNNFENVNNLCLAFLSYQVKKIITDWDKIYILDSMNNIAQNNIAKTFFIKTTESINNVITLSLIYNKQLNDVEITINALYTPCLLDHIKSNESFLIDKK